MFMVRLSRMWRDLSVSAEMPDRPRAKRYLAFVDYLGTRQLYRDPNANADLIEDRRYELEHGIHFWLQRAVAEKKLEVGVFSDTVLIAGSDIQQVLTSSAVLLNFVLQKTINRSDSADIRLLRGGISKGIELRSAYLRPAPGIHVIPFFDSSLAFAFELEEVRRGSRLYIDRDITDADLGKLRNYTFAWTQMTGFGTPAIDIREFLWPAYIYAAKTGELCAILDACMSLWRRVLSSAPLGRDRYRDTLYHLDETIKVIIRSFVVIPEGPSVNDAIERLLSHLPRPEDRMDDVDIGYVWGIWFQIAYLLAHRGIAQMYGKQLSFMFQELKRRRYFDKFLSEIDHPNYEIMRALAKLA